MWVQESRRIFAWGLLLPVVATLFAPCTAGLSLVLWLAYPLNTIRIARRFKREGKSRPWTLAFFLMLGKFPEAVGWMRFHWGRLSGKRSEIIEHKRA
jgi:hypothetical protein